MQMLNVKSNINSSSNEVNSCINSQETSSTITIEDREVLLALLQEYGNKLILLCQKISDLQVKILSSKCLILLIFIVFGCFLTTIYFYLRISWIIGGFAFFLMILLGIYIISVSNQESKMLKLISNEAHRISVRLEKVVRLGYQIQENLTSNLVKKLELDLRLADAESALEYYKKICH